MQQQVAEVARLKHALAAEQSKGAAVDKNEVRTLLRSLRAQAEEAETVSAELQEALVRFCKRSLLAQRRARKFVWWHVILRKIAQCP